MRCREQVHTGRTRLRPYRYRDLDGQPTGGRWPPTHHRGCWVEYRAYKWRATGPYLLVKAQIAGHNLRDGDQRSRSLGKASLIGPEVTVASRGVVYVHSCPAAVCPHVEWAISSVLGTRVTLAWTAQPVAPGQLRAECVWTGNAGTAARLAAALRPWAMLRFEVTEDPSPGCDGERLAYVPGRGIFRSSVSANGDLVVAEDQLRALRTTARTAEDYEHALDRLLGAAWDAELEPYRHAGDGAPVTWLHQVV